MPKPDPYFKGWPRCDGCVQPVAIADSVAAIDFNAVVRRQRQRGAPVEGPVNLGKFVTNAINIEPWFLGHVRCEPATCTYDIDGQELTTTAGALRWTIHLAEKRWFEHYTWQRAMGRLFYIHNMPKPVPGKKAERRDMSLGLRVQVFTRDGFRCRYCGAQPPMVVLEIDHVVPVSLGGPTRLENLATACYECNRGKRDRLMVPPALVLGGTD